MHLGLFILYLYHLLYITRIINLYYLLVYIARRIIYIISYSIMPVFVYYLILPIFM